MRIFYLALFALISSCAGSPKIQKKEPTPLETLNRLYSEGKQNEVYELAQNLLAKPETREIGFYYISIIETQRGNLKMALWSIRKTLETENSRIQPKVRYQQARVLWLMGKKYKSLEELHQLSSSGFEPATLFLDQLSNPSIARTTP